MKKIAIFFAVSLILNACSFSPFGKEEVASKPSDEMEFAVDVLDPVPAADIKVEEQQIAEQPQPDEILPVEKVENKPEDTSIVTNLEEGKEQLMEAPEEPKFQDFQKESVPVITAETQPATLGAQENYHIQKGETLMMVAFKIYGDYRKWKDLKEWNKDKKMGAGSVLKYYVPEKSFGWQPSGVPYLVKTGDTLGIISLDKYGTPKKWRNIYENNRPLIRDPNLIFAGFTIYYVPARDVASEPR